MKDGTTKEKEKRTEREQGEEKEEEQKRRKSRLKAFSGPAHGCRRKVERVHQTSHGLLDMEGMHDWVFSRTAKNGSGVCLFLGILLLMKVEMERRRGCGAGNSI